MLLSLLLDYLKKIAPNEYQKQIKDHFFEVGTTNEIEKKVVKKILVTPTPTFDAINYAKQIKANIVICYNPLIPKELNTIDESVNIKLMIMAQNNIMLYLLNDSWNISEYGTHETLCEYLGLEILKPIFFERNGENLSIGRFCRNTILKRDFNSFLFDIKRHLNLTSIEYYLNDTIEEEKIFNNILVYAGDGLKIQDIVKAQSIGIKCIITGDIENKSALLCRDYGISLIKLTKYQSIKPGYEKLSRILSSEFLIDVEFFDSKSIFDIYK